MTKTANVGIDYSITCPCMAVYWSDQAQSGYDFHYVKDEARFIGYKVHENYTFTGHPYPKYATDVERYDRISEIFINVLSQYTIKKINIEAYSYGSNGKAFNIAENTGLLKHKIYKNFGLEVKAISPMTLKKVATGKGAGKKDVMIKAWDEQMPSVDLYSILKVKRTKNVGNPISDIIDSYYLTKC